jgi:hypothetical protein
VKSWKRSERAFACDQSAGGLESEDADHLGRPQKSGGATWPSSTSESAGSHAVAEQDARYGDALIEAFALSRFEASPVLSVEMNDLAEIGPEECTVCEDTGTDHRITSKSTLGDYPRGDRVGIVLYIDPAGRRATQVGMMDQRIVAKTHLSGDTLHEEGKVAHRCCSPGGTDEGIRQRHP